MSTIPKAKCENCENCKLISMSEVVVCDYLNDFYRTLTAQAFHKPKHCPKFKKKVKEIKQ